MTRNDMLKVTFFFANQTSFTPLVRLPIECDQKGCENASSKREELLNEFLAMKLG